MNWESPTKSVISWKWQIKSREGGGKYQTTYCYHIENKGLFKVLLCRKELVGAFQDGLISKVVHSSKG